MDSEEIYASGQDASCCEGINCGRVIYSIKDNPLETEHILPVWFYQNLTQLNRARLCRICHIEKTRVENKIRDLYKLDIISKEEADEFLRRNSKKYYGQRVDLL